MPLTSGTLLGPYEILAPLGAGGMGEVYRARDAKLDRVIAIKVLPAAIAGDAQLRERFEREARAVAALNHPNIVTIHSVEEADGVPFITMELVEGRTLAELIPRGGMSLDQLLDAAIPLADAIAAAHQRGVTHRDLKPGNVMIADDGRLKVLDFGLAKRTDAAGPAAEATALPTGNLTGEGRIVGTVAYMSPEQAEGKIVDHRTDLFSLGVILYEMATGERPFTGDSSLSVLSSIMKDTPRLASEVNPRVPRELARIIRRALAKDPENRYQSAKDLRNELRELKQEADSGELAAPSIEKAPRGWGASIAWLSAAGVAIVLGVVVTWLVARRPAQAPPASVEVTFTQLTSEAGIEQFPSVSPDGTWVVYVSAASGNPDIYLRSAGGRNAINLTKDSPAGDTQPAFSPDGARIAFRSDRQGGGIFVMGRTGEFAKKVSDIGFNPAWSPDGKELVVSTVNIGGTNPYGRSDVGQLWIVNNDNGERRLLYKGDAESDAVQPQWSSHGHRIAFWGLRRGGSQRDIWTIAAAGGPPVAVTSDAALDWNPVWSRDGRHLYFSSDRGGSLNLWRVPIDEKTGAVTGPLQAVTTPSAYVAHLSMAGSGAQLAYSAVTSTSNIQRFELDPASGAIAGSGAWLTSGSESRRDLDVSWDGQWVVFRVGERQEDLFICRTDGTGLQQLTNDAARDRFPRWSPDGRRIVFWSDRDADYELWTVAADGGGALQLTKRIQGGGAGFTAWSPDGTRLASTDGRTHATSALLDPAKTWGDQRPDFLPPLGKPPRTFVVWSWSPDGARIAGRVDGGGIVVYDLATGRYDEMSAEPLASDPYWLPDSRRIVYRTNDRIKLIDTKTRQTRELLSAAPDVLWSLAVSRDGRQLFVLRGANEADIWLATLKSDAK